MGVMTPLIFADKDTHSIVKYLHTLRDAVDQGVDLTITWPELVESYK